MKSIICIFVFILSPFFAFSQQEELGPNGGQLKSAGDFLTEVISQKDGSFHVYLLDKETKKPTIRYSYVTGFFESAGGSKVEILCVGNKVFFECHPRGWNLKKGKKLSLSLARNNVAGSDVVYNLPLFNPKALDAVQGRIVHALKIDKNQKFMKFIDGKRTYVTINQLEDNSSYCVIENIKLQKLTIKPKKKFSTKVEKVSLPNPKVNRYSILSNKDYNLYCDLSADADFKESAVLDKVNQHLLGWLKLK